MKIWTEPKVTLLASTTAPVEASGTSFGFLLDDEESIVEFAGRLCYLSFGEGVDGDGHKTIKGRTTTEGYIANILNVKHGSVIEHANYTFLFEGISRSLTHELVRHRHFSYSQLSQRYVDESGVGFVVPPELLNNIELQNTWKDFCSEMLDMYNHMLREIESDIVHRETINTTTIKKRIRQTARSVLPNCTETKIVVTGNARAWRHFLTLRGNNHADTEIKRLAIEVFKILKDLSPNLFRDFSLVNGEVISEIGSI